MAHEIELPRSPNAPVAARRFLEANAGPVGDGALGDARLIVSELVTNALLHGQGRIYLTLEHCGDALRIEVADEGTGEAPAIRDQPEAGVGGWGLRIVDIVAVRWGAVEGSTHVWAEIALDS